MNPRLVRILGGNTAQYPHALESQFPRILETLLSRWDEDEINACFTELLVDGRGDRAGFPPEVAADILHLSLVHAAQEAPEKCSGIWDVEPSSFANFTPHHATEPNTPPQDLNAAPEAFFTAIENGDRAAVMHTLSTQSASELRDPRGWTPLMMAAFSGQKEMLALLLHHQADVNAQDTGGNRALHWAAFGGDAACAQLLLQHHAKPDAHNHFGWTPLLQAAARNHPEVAKLLIDAGVNLDSATEDGYTALHQASAAGYHELVELLLTSGADRNCLTHEGDTALKLARKNGQDAIAARLGQAG